MNHPKFLIFQKFNPTKIEQITIQSLSLRLGSLGLWVLYMKDENSQNLVSIEHSTDAPQGCIIDRQIHVYSRKLKMPPNVLYQKVWYQLSTTPWAL